MATLDTSLFKLNKNAFAILSDAYAKMPEIAIDAIDSKGSPKQPKLLNQLIEVGALYEQIMEHIILNDAGTQIIGIEGENVSTINALLACLKDAAGLNTLSSFPTPLQTVIVTVPGGTFPVGPPGSLLVSNGTTYIVFPPGAAGTVVTSDGAGNLVYSSVVGNGLPAGGLAGQHLVKNSNTSFDVIWQTQVFADNSDVTTTATEVNILSGVNTGSIGAAQINTLVGINTGLTIQQQLDALGTPALPDGQFWVGNALNVATPRTPTGDVTFNNTGVFAISPNVIVNADVSTTAGIMRGKLASGTSHRLVVNNASGVMSDAAAILPNRALVSDANGIPTHSNVTTSVLNFISTLTGNAQTQLDSKLTVSLTSVAEGDTLFYNGTNWVNLPIGANGEVLTSNGTTVSWGSSTANGIPVGGTAQQVLRKIDATNYNTEWHTQVFADNSDVTTSAAEVNLIDGLTVNATKLNYTTDVTSNIQAQLDNKQSRSLAYNALWVGDASNFAVQLTPGSNNQVLTIVNGAPIWETPSPPGDVSGPGVGNSTDNAIARWNGINGDSLNNSGVIIDDANNITGVTSLSSGQIDILNQAALRLHETGSTNYVEIRAFGTMGSNYTITLPAAAPPANTSLTYDGADYVWAASGGAIAFTDLTDVPSSYATHALKLVRVNAGETALEFVTPSGTGTVTSVTGTTDRITITGTPTVNPTVDIAATYIGQASITTVGTIVTGVWNGTDVALAAGGTGASLVAPGVDRIFFYDQSALSTAFLEVGSGLTITGTVLTATGSYTDEQAQDAVGNILTDTATIDFTYDDATPTISAIVVNNSIGNSQIRQSAALSVIGNSTNSTANVADIVGTNGQVLRVSGTTLGFGQILSSSINMSTARMLGRTTASTGAAEEITVENGLTLAALTLKLGGALTGNTSFTGAGFDFTATGIGTYSFSATAATLTTPAGGSVSLSNNVAQSLSLGATGGAVLNLGSDAPGDTYYRDSLGKFVRLIIGEVGQTLIVSDSGLPDWSNMIPIDVGGTTYVFQPEDNGKRFRFTNASGCNASITAGLLPAGWLILAYRAVGAGTVTFSGGVGVTLEGVGTTIPAEKTSAALYHRGADFIEITGAVSAIGTGTVTSVALANITGLATSSGGPIVTAGTLTLSLNTQVHNTIFAGPSGLSDPDAAPTFRAAVLEDLPEDDWVEVSGTTYTLQDTDDKHILYCTNAGGCVITIPAATLITGYSAPVYRSLGAGTVTFSPAVGVTLEAVATTISIEETMAVVMHQGGDLFVLAGSLGTGGGGASAFIDLTDVPSSYATHSLKAVRVNAGETGLEFFTISGTGTVTSVSGTTNRITITGTPTINPTVDIAATYVGQTSITTLGTIGTGVWQGTSISTSFTDANIITVTGTTDRITITGTATDPIFNIAATYIGQNTITTLGTITTGVWNGTAVAAGFGGTGQMTYTIGDILQASATTTLSKLAAVATGNVLISGGVGTVSSWGKVGLATHVSGTLPIANGGTNLTALGSANQILAVNNAGTALEYKTVSTSTTAVSNDVGVTLTGANSLVINVPSASATVRGVVTTGTQTFTGTKTFTNNSSSSLALFVDSGAATGLKMYVAAAESILEGYGSNDLKILSPSSTNLILQGRGVSLKSTGASSSPFSFTALNSMQPKDFVAINGSFYDFLVSGTGTQLHIQGLSRQTTGSVIHHGIGLHITTTINRTTAAATSTFYGILYQPVETDLTNTAHYGVVVASSTGAGTALSGFGIATPTARLQTRGINNGIAFLAEDDAANRIFELGETGGARYTKLDLGSDATGDIYYRNSSGNLTRLGVGTNTHVLTLSAGLPVWAAGGGSFILTDGNGTVANSTAVDLGGDLLQDTLIGSNGTPRDFQMGTFPGDLIGDFTVYSSGSFFFSAYGGSAATTSSLTLSSAGTATLTTGAEVRIAALAAIADSTDYFDIKRLTASTTGIANHTLFEVTSTSTPTAGFGLRNRYSVENGSNTQPVVMTEEITLSTVTAGSEDATYKKQIMINGGLVDVENITTASGLSRTFLGDVIVGASGAKVGFFETAAVVQQVSGADLTNNVTSGGTNDQIDDFTNLAVYATDAAAIRNAIYQLARKLKMINDGLRDYGLFT